MEKEELNEKTDEEIVGLVKEDKELYAEIMYRYGEKLMRYAFYITKDREKSADAVQNSFIKAFANLNNFNNKMKFSSWIYRIVHNESINEISRYNRETSIGEDDDFESEENLEAELSREEIRKEVGACLSNLPLKYSEPLSLHFIEEKSYEDITDILRLPIGTVGTRINRGKILLRKICRKIKN